MQVYVAYSTENGSNLLLKIIRLWNIIELIIRLFKPESVLATDFGKSG